MNIKQCDVCGREFEPRHETDKYCNDCRVEMYKASPIKKPEPITSRNDKLMEQVREAAKLGLNYGQYKGRQK